MQKRKSLISLLIFLVLLITHAVINNINSYRGSNLLLTGILLSGNILLLLYGNFVLLKKYLLLPGLFFWLAFLWFTPDLMNFLAGSESGIGLRIIYWIEFFLMIVFLLRENAFYEELAEKANANTS